MFALLAYPPPEHSTEGGTLHATLHEPSSDFATFEFRKRKQTRPKARRKLKLKIGSPIIRLQNVRRREPNHSVVNRALSTAESC